MLQQLATLPPYSQVYASLAFELNMDLAQVKKLEEEKIRIFIGMVFSHQMIKPL